MSDKSEAAWHPYGSPDDWRWRCVYCDRRWPIPSLARDCETRHEREAEASQMRPEEDQ